MASSDSDDDLKRAIAMSLAEASTNNTIHNDDDEDDDEDIRRAIALSLGENENTRSADLITKLQAGSMKTESQYPASMASKGNAFAQAQPADSALGNKVGLLSLDRKAMEQERLARLAKRKRSASPERPSKQVAKAAPKNDNTSTAPETLHNTGIQYPHGVAKRTWAHKNPRVNDITLDEVLQSSTLNIAVFSAFQWDNEWLFDHHIDAYKVKQIWIMSGKAHGTDVTAKLLREAEDAKIPNFKAHFPPLPGQTQNMHGKLMLLFHKDHLRVVVPTANMIKFDWGETNRDERGVSWQSGVMENMVFLIDLPRRGDESIKEVKTEFRRNLLMYLEAQEVPKNVIDGVLKFDFSETKHLGFVHSIAGPSSGPERLRTGLPCLAKTVCELNLHRIARLEIDYAASSLGAIKEAFLKQIYLAACGLPPLTQTKVNVLDHFRIYFPLKDTVHTSTGGPDCGGIITMNRSWFNAATFPRRCFRDYKSTRRGLLSHNKLMFVRGVRSDGRPIAWAYIGSANLSEAAWGMQTILKSGKEGSSLMRNWECGVIVPVPAGVMASKGVKNGELPGMEVFEGTVDVPFEFPGEEYGNKEPWFFRE